jgi:Lon protease-like protein
VIQIPKETPLMVLPTAVLFPHSLLPLHIFENRYREMLAYSLDGDRMFCVALTKRGVGEASSLGDLCPVAGIGLIRACVGNEDGTSNLVLQGLARVRLVEWSENKSFKIGRIELVESAEGNLVEEEALGEKVKELCLQIAEIGLQLPPNLIEHLKLIESPDVLSDVVASAFISDPYQRQQLLEAVGVSDRLRLLILFLRSIVKEG